MECGIRRKGDPVSFFESRIDTGNTAYLQFENYRKWWTTTFKGCLAHHGRRFIMAVFFVIRGHDRGSRLDTDADIVRIGRDSANDIQLHDSEVSRFHAEVRKTESGFELVDLNSSNGSYINSTRVSQKPLRTGDRIQFGRSTIVFTAEVDLTTRDISAAEVDLIANPPAESQIIQRIRHDESQVVFSDDISVIGNVSGEDRNVQLLYQTALAASHTLDVKTLLARIMKLILDSVAADRGCVILFDEETGDLKPAVRMDRDGDVLAEKLQVSKTILDYVLDKSEGVLTSDAGDDDRWERKESIVHSRVREAICVPMQGRYGIVGAIYLDTQQEPSLPGTRPKQCFKEEHLKLMVAIGHQAALAIEDTSYYSAMMKAERMAAMGHTITAISHHIKNMLQGVNGGKYLVDEGLKSGKLDVIERGWNIVQRNQQRISDLVLDMLSYSKERKPEKTPTDLNDVVSEVVEVVGARARDDDTELLFERTHGIKEYFFDAHGIQRAILNVVTNALDACQDVSGGRVNISAELDADREFLCVVVSDNGEGIPKERQDDIFTLFSSNKGSRGTGLGLAVSRKVLREHDGDVVVHSEPGAGSVFTIEWPAVSAKEQSERKRSGSSIISHSLSDLNQH